MALDTLAAEWLPNAPMKALGTLNLVSDTMAACERIPLASEADFPLCHYHGRVPARFEGERPL